jgi:hypothetical protein
MPTSERSVLYYNELMNQTYWPLLLPVAFGSIPFFFATRSVRNGVAYGRNGKPVERSEDPLGFWFLIFMMYFIGAVFFAFPIYVCLRGGILMK